jgi:hypothetical protein
MVLLALLPLAAASSFVVSVGPEISLGVGGGWARIFPDGDDAWSLLWSAGGDYNRLPMTADLTVTDEHRIALTGRSNLIDHAIAPCPDGTWLHTASANLDAANDSAYAFRYAADWSLLASATIEERQDTRIHNDMAVLCDDAFQGVIFGERGASDSSFFLLDADAAPTGPTTLEQSPPMSGGSFLHDPERDELLALNYDPFSTLFLTRYTPALAVVDAQQLEGVPAPLRGYWAQAVMRVGDVWIVAHMARDQSLPWSADEGDVWLSFYDTDWALLEQVQVSHNTPPSGGMRPGLARRGDQLLVSYDRDVQPRVFDVRLDLAALGADGVTGGDTDADTGAGSAEGSGPGCGCGTGTPASGLAVLLALAAWSRRRAIG